MPPALGHPRAGAPGTKDGCGLAQCRACWGARHPSLLVVISRVLVTLAIVVCSGLLLGVSLNQRVEGRLPHGPPLKRALPNAPEMPVSSCGEGPVPDSGGDGFYPQANAVALLQEGDNRKKVTGGWIACRCQHAHEALGRDVDGGRELGEPYRRIDVVTQDRLPVSRRRQWRYRSLHAAKLRDNLESR